MTQAPTRPPTRTATLPPPPSKTQPATKIQFGKVAKNKSGHRVVIFGPGGIGKTTLACLAKGKTVAIDADESLEKLAPQLAQVGADIPEVIPGVTDFKSMRAALQSSGWDGVQNIVFDTVTRIEQWCSDYTIATVPHEKGKKITRIEDYGFGKGLQHIFDTYLLFLADLDRHVRAGRNVFLIAHECVSNVPNPNGEDWIRWEPRLQNPNSGKASIRLFTKEWSDHVLFFGYDVIAKDGKGQGYGSRTIYTAEKPFCMAKSRTASSLESIPITFGESPWEQILV